MTTVRIVDGLKYGFKFLGVYLLALVVSGGVAVGGLSIAGDPILALRRGSLVFDPGLGAGATRQVLLGGLGVVAVGVLLWLAFSFGLLYKLVADGVATGVALSPKYPEPADSGVETDESDAGSTFAADSSGETDSGPDEQPEETTDPVRTPPAAATASREDDDVLSRMQSTADDADSLASDPIGGSPDTVGSTADAAAADVDAPRDSPTDDGVTDPPAVESEPTVPESNTSSERVADDDPFDTSDEDSTASDRLTAEDLGATSGRDEIDDGADTPAAVGSEDDAESGFETDVDAGTDGFDETTADAEGEADAEVGADDETISEPDETVDEAAVSSADDGTTEAPDPGYQRDIERENAAREATPSDRDTDEEPADAEADDPADYDAKEYDERGYPRGADAESGNTTDDDAGIESGTGAADEDESDAVPTDTGADPLNESVEPPKPSEEFVERTQEPVDETTTEASDDERVPLDEPLTDDEPESEADDSFDTTDDDETVPLDEPIGDDDEADDESVPLDEPIGDAEDANDESVPLDEPIEDADIEDTTDEPGDWEPLDESDLKD